MYDTMQMYQLTPSILCEISLHRRYYLTIYNITLSGLSQSGDTWYIYMYVREFNKIWNSDEIFKYDENI